MKTDKKTTYLWWHPSDDMGKTRPGGFVWIATTYNPAGTDALKRKIPSLRWCRKASLINPDAVPAGLEKRSAWVMPAEYLVEAVYVVRRNYGPYAFLAGEGKSYRQVTEASVASEEADSAKRMEFVRSLKEQIRAHRGLSDSDGTTPLRDDDDSDFEEKADFDSDTSESQWGALGYYAPIAFHAVPLRCGYVLLAVHHPGGLDGGRPMEVTAKPRERYRWLERVLRGWRADPRCAAPIPAVGGDTPSATAALHEHRGCLEIDTLSQLCTGADVSEESYAADTVATKVPESVTVHVLHRTNEGGRSFTGEGSAGSTMEAVRRLCDWIGSPLTVGGQ